jgi:hypothetical protein
MFLNSMIKLLNNLCTHFIQMKNNVFLFASIFLSLFLVLTGLVAPLYAQQNQTASNMTSMQQSEGIGTASELENLTGDNTPMMQNNTDMSNTSLAEGLQAEQNTTEMTMNQTGEGAQTAMNQTGEGAQTAMNQTGEGAQTAMNETGEALSNASKSGIAANASQAGQSIANKTGEAATTVVNETGDILSNITEGLKGMLGIK